MLVALDHVQLAAPPDSEPVLRTYYVDVLGMTETPKPPALAARGGCWFAAGGVQLPKGAGGSTRRTRSGTGSNSSNPWPDLARLSEGSGLSG
jgi:hypothetical protein